jgi:hypothetical protein
MAVGVNGKRIEQSKHVTSNRTAFGSSVSSGIGAAWTATLDNAPTSIKATTFDGFISTSSTR